MRSKVCALNPDGSYDHKTEESLKAIITQLVAGVERKFFETQQVVIPCRLAVLTNHVLPLPIGRSAFVPLAALII